MAVVPLLAETPSVKIGDELPPFCSALVVFVGPSNEWAGTAVDLLDGVTTAASDSGLRPEHDPYWPEEPADVRSAIRVYSDLLGKHGIVLQTKARGGKSSLKIRTGRMCAISAHATAGRLTLRREPPELSESFADLLRQSRRQKPARRTRVERGVYRRPDGEYEIGWRDEQGLQRWRAVGPSLAEAREALASVKSTSTPGIDVRHSKKCGSRLDGECSCTPSYQAHVFDKTTGSRIRKTFPSKAEARQWRKQTIADLASGLHSPGDQPQPTSRPSV